ncbi:MAG: hypothetical protein ABIP21_06805, partial [Acidimicrobiia bacterium]
EAGTGDASTLIEVARDRGIAVATPAGIDFSFNGGPCCGTAARPKEQRNHDGERQNRSWCLHCSPRSPSPA